MPTSNPAQILLAHNTRATRQFIQASSGLPEEQFHRRFEMGVGSIHDTLRHILGAMRSWAELLAGKEFSARLETQGNLTPQKLVELNEQIAADFSGHALGRPLDETVSRDRGGKMYTFTRGAVLTHVMTHGMHHRAQCLNMFRQIGVNPLPKSSVMEWTISPDGDPAGV